LFHRGSDGNSRRARAGNADFDFGAVRVAEGTHSTLERSASGFSGFSKVAIGAAVRDGMRLSISFVNVVDATAEHAQLIFHH
jgi:hypothetical protein